MFSIRPANSSSLVEAKGGWILAVRLDRYPEHVSDVPVLLAIAARLAR